MQKVFVSANCKSALRAYLRDGGYEVVSVAVNGVVARALSDHPDMFMCKLGVAPDSEIVFSECVAGAPGAISNQHSGGLLRYPLDIAYNAACTGKFFIHNLKYTAAPLMECAHNTNTPDSNVNCEAPLMECAHNGLIFVDVRQGYTKCSTVVVDEDSIITYDKGIAAPCRAAGMNVLMVEPGHVILPGFDTGFIGGASGRVGNEVIFNGNLDAHPDAERIREFITARDLTVVSFPDWPLTDIGSII